MATWYLPTNRHNLLGMWSAEMLSPASSLIKYRPDLLADAPGRLVLSPGGIDAAMVGAVSDDEAHSFPVMIELDLPEESAVPKGPGGLAAPAGVVPVSRVGAIHVRSKRESSEIEARNFANVRGANLPLQVTPDLFASPQTTPLQDTRSWLRGLEPIERPTVRERTVIDRLAGALALVAPLATRDITVLAWWAEQIRLWGDQTDATEHPASALSDLLPGGADGPGEGRLLSALSGIILARSVDGPPVPSEVIAALKDELTEGATPDERMLAALDRVDQTVRGLRPFEPFQNPASQPVLKALFLFLVRPDPEEISTWTNEESGADARLLALGTALSGFNTGYRRLPLELRGSEALRELVVAGVADQLNTLATSSLPLFAPGVSVDVTETADGRRTVVSAGPAVLVDTTLPIGTATQVVDGAHAVRIADHLGWTDCVRTVVTGTSVQIVPSGKKVVLVLPGDAAVLREIVEERFSERSAELGPEAIKEAASATMEGETPRATPRKRRSPKKAASTPAQSLLAQGPETATTAKAPDAGGGSG